MDAPDDPALTEMILDAISQGVLIAGPDRRLISANQAFLQITGYVPSEIIGRDCAFMQGIDTDPVTILAIRDALSHERRFDGEILNYRRNGMSFWNELTILPIHDAEGHLTHFVGTSRDISARKRAESAQNDADQRYRSLVEHIPAGVVVHGVDSAILLANTAASLILGLSVEQLLGLVAVDPKWHFIDEVGRALTPDAFPVNRVLSTHNALRDLVVGIVRPDRDLPTWVICNAFPVVDPQFALLEVVVSFTDITGLKQAEQALQKSEERLRLVLQGSNDAPWDWELQSDNIYYSPRWWQMLGFELDELPADSTLWARHIHPDDQGRVADHFGEALAGCSQGYEVEFRLLHKQGHYVPVLSRGFILRDSTGKAIRVSGTNTDLTERKQAEEQIHQLAFYDALTGLPNRRLLIEQTRKALAASARSGKQGALLFIDLDNFKALNDTLGHAKGDELLQQVAQRLLRSVRSTDSVARLGGDEFVVMLEDLAIDPRAAAIEAELVGKKIIHALGQSYLLACQNYISTPSIGIALFQNGEQGVDGLLKQADLAMYQAKSMGRNTLRFFDASMQTAVDERVALETALRSGLERDEMALHFQPQVNHFGEVTGAEILLRWQHPTRGLVPPNEFIPLAESTGMIRNLGSWVLHRACLQLVAWSFDPVLAGLSLSVNVSPEQFRDADFVTALLAMLEDTGANPKKLKLELTESLLAENVDDVIAKMVRLKAHGIGFSLDDFGTGYSSLGYLQRMPLEQLKIDQSFVREVLTNPNDATIAQIIITLGEKLGLAVIAEGVESDGQRQFLLDHGCLGYQGFLFGKPMKLEEFEAAMRSE
jgi:diguanylate cyclase (GGDEF)-like protein/PAS domain S-box-containing protein